MCEDCGRQEVWTARQQKWYYEVVKVSLYARAVRCLDCRRRRRSEKGSGRGDPNPIKHLGTLMKAVRSQQFPVVHKSMNPGEKWPQAPVNSDNR